MNDKQLVAIHAAKHVQSDMLVGLGTGSTANFFIEELARRQQEEHINITVVSSSNVSMIKAQALGLNVISIQQVRAIDLYVDGADEITPDLTLLKGRGYDLVMEKLLAKAAQQFFVVADKSKLVSRIGEQFNIPIEVLPNAWQTIKSSIEQIGGNGNLRPNVAKDGLSISSHGSLILDMSFDKTIAAAELNQRLNDIPGVVEHGIFYQLATAAFIADNGNIEEKWH